MGNKAEKKAVAKDYGAQGQQLIQVKQNRLHEERKRDLAETQQCQQRQNANFAAMDEQAANSR